MNYTSCGAADTWKRKIEKNPSNIVSFIVEYVCSMRCLYTEFYPKM